MKNWSALCDVRTIRFENIHIAIWKRCHEGWRCTLSRYHQPPSIVYLKQLQYFNLDGYFSASGVQIVLTSKVQFVWIGEVEVVHSCFTLKLHGTDGVDGAGRCQLQRHPFSSIHLRFRSCECGLDSMNILFESRIRHTTHAHISLITELLGMRWQREREREKKSSLYCPQEL